VNRALRAATMGVLLLSPVALSACSAGQVTQTATQERDKVGAMGQVGDLTLRAVQLESPRGGSYDRGDDAELRMVIVNSGVEPDALVGISGEGFAEVEFDTGSTASNDEIVIPGDSSVVIGGDGASVRLIDLDEDLSTGEHLQLTFEFENAGEVTLPVTVATPQKSQERGEAFDFHQEEGGGH
jgi:copper(I)-binding protein